MATAHKTTRNPGKWVMYRLIPGGARVDSLPEAKKQAQQRANEEGQEVQVAKYFMSHLGSTYKPSVMVFSAKPKLKGKRNIDPLSAMALMQGTGADTALFGKRGFRELSHTPGRRGRNPEDIDFLNALAPIPSLGHISFTPDGIERFYRDGFTYQAFSSTPVFADGYRMGAVEGVASQLAVTNPYDPRVDDLKEELRRLQAITGSVSEGSISSTQVARMSETQKKKWLAQKQRQFDIEREINAIEHADEIATAKLKKAREGRLAQLDRQIMDAQHMIKYAIDRGKRAPKAYVRTLEIAEKEKAEILSKPNPSRRNPASEADQLYEDFHGTPPTETLEYHETLHFHAHLGGLADLCHVVVKIIGGSKNGKELQLNAPDPERANEADVVKLTANEARNQLYFTGGDQSLDLKSLGFRESFDVVHDGETFESTEIKDNMVIGYIHRIMYRTEKKFDNFETIDYHHEAGEDTGCLPFLTYDTLNNKMGVAGGSYVIHEKGIVN